MSINEVDLLEGSIHETQETSEESEGDTEEGDTSGSSSSSSARNEVLSNRENPDQDVAQSGPSFLLRGVVTLDANASVTPIGIAKSSRALLFNSTLAAPLPMLLSPCSPIGQTISSQAGLFQRQYFPSLGVSEGESIIMSNHGPPFPANPHHQAVGIGPPNYNYYPSSAARPAAPQIHRSIPRYMERLGNANSDSSTLMPRWANRHHQGQLALIDPPPIFGQQVYRRQSASSSDLQQGDDFHQMQVVNMPSQTRMGAPIRNPLQFQPEVGMSSTYNDNQVPPNVHQVNWTPLRQSFLIPTPPPNPGCPKNSLYDPSYEIVGLPVDPHLRMFLAEERHTRNDEDK